MIVRVLPLLVLLFAATCKPPDSTNDATLVQNVTAIRKAIAAYHRETGRYPHALSDLVPKHLPRIPPDPFTGSSTSWRVITEEAVQPSTDFQTATTTVVPSVIVDVHSTAPGADRNGMPYSNY